MIKQKQKNIKLVLFLSLAINLGILFYFKYFIFIIDNINILLNLLNINLIRHFDILLPVGISFYTFQALSYSMDVYRGDVKVEKSFVKYALFVSFFPQLVAGPIEKSKDFLKQFNFEHKFNYLDCKNGLLIILGGYILKLVIADRAAIAINQVYNNLPDYTGIYLIIATFLFAIQIYCDFYSYSLIAKGSAKILGYKLSDNFDTPYLATSIKDFWRRWHISLSTWFKEYLYFPLGGSRVTLAKNIRNILIVFLVSGLWHGASWNFVIWGLLHGFYQVIGILTKKIREKFINSIKLNKFNTIHKIIQIITTFILVNFAWIFFRANTLNDAIYVLKNIFNLSSGLNIQNIGLDMYNMILLGISIILLFIYELNYKKITLISLINKRNIVFRWLIYFTIIFTIIILGIYGPQYSESQFIYFQF